MPEEQLIEERYKKFRVLGKFIEANNIEEIYSEIPRKLELKLAFITGAQVLENLLQLLLLMLAGI